MRSAYPPIALTTLLCLLIPGTAAGQTTTGALRGAVAEGRGPFCQECRSSSTGSPRSGASAQPSPITPVNFDFRIWHPEFTP